MPDFDDTTGCAPTQEPAPPADNHFVGVTIDTCAAIADAYNQDCFEALRKGYMSADNYGRARSAAAVIAGRIRALKQHL